jgi:drug/metabolite transporter (DMT)-like permease
VISYVAAFFTAVLNAAGNVVNRAATRKEPAGERFRLRLMLNLIRRPLWLAAVAIMLASFVLGAVALGAGQLAAVQIIIIVELPMTLIGGLLFLGGGLGRREWAAIAALTAGVAGLLACLNPTSGHRTAVPGMDWVIGSAVNGGLVAALFLIARAARRPAQQAALLGVATGLGYGLASAYTKGMTLLFASGGVLGVLSSWELYAAAVTGIAATWLLQNAYHAGRLAAAQPGITMCDPMAATSWGVLAFGEHVQTGLFLGLAVLPAAVLVTGVVLLSRSEALQGTAGTPGKRGGEGRQPAGGDGAERAGTRASPAAGT